MGVLRRATVVAIVALATLVVIVPAAGAVTFGADLGVAPDNTDPCPLSSSCMFFSGYPGPVFYAPDNGTITAVRVRVGPTTGSMQIMVLSSLYRNHYGDPGHPYYACCFVQQYGPVFTPAANATTTVATSLPMVEQPTPLSDDYVTNARGDFLAISVLTPGVPVPAVYDGSSGFSLFVPAPDPSTTPAPSPNPISPYGSAPGYHMMMSADLDTSGGGGGGGGTGTTPGNPLVIPSGGQLLGTNAAVRLTCALTGACRGTIKLANRAVTANANVFTFLATKSKLRTYGQKRFSIPAGKTRTVKIKLNKAGRKALGRHKTLTATATATVGTQTMSQKIKFKRKRR